MAKVPPCPDLTGVPPLSRPDLAAVSPTPGCEQTENITFPILHAGGNDLIVQENLNGLTNVETRLDGSCQG